MRKSSLAAMWLSGSLLALGSGAATGVVAGEADVVAVDWSRAQDGSYSFDVTVRHDDEGWEHYADGWEVLGPEGKVLARRELAHPHVDEQPFTRSLSGVRISDEVQRVTLRAHDKTHGYGGRELTVELR